MEFEKVGFEQREFVHFNAIGFYGTEIDAVNSIFNLLVVTHSLRENGLGLMQPK